MKKTVGIVLLVLGIMALFGSVVNGSFASYAQGIILPDIIALILMVGMVIGGIVLIIKGKND